MSASDVTKNALDLLAEITEVEEVRSQPDLALYDLQILDSMKLVQLIVAVESRVGVEISPADFERDRWSTPAQFVADLLRRSAL